MNESEQLVLLIVVAVVGALFLTGTIVTIICYRRRQQHRREEKKANRRRPRITPTGLSMVKDQERSRDEPAASTIAPAPNNAYPQEILYQQRPPECSAVTFPPKPPSSANTEKRGSGDSSNSAPHSIFVGSPFDNPHNNNNFLNSSGSQNNMILEESPIPPRSVEDVSTARRSAGHHPQNSEPTTPMGGSGGSALTSLALQMRQQAHLQQRAQSYINNGKSSARVLSPQHPVRNQQVQFQQQNLVSSSSIVSPPQILSPLHGRHPHNLPSFSQQIQPQQHPQQKPTEWKPFKLDSSSTTNANIQGLPPQTPYINSLSAENDKVLNAPAEASNTARIRATLQGALNRNDDSVSPQSSRECSPKKTSRPSKHLAQSPSDLVVESSDPREFDSEVTPPNTNVGMTSFPPVGGGSSSRYSISWKQANRSFTKKNPGSAGEKFLVPPLEIPPNPMLAPSRGNDSAGSFECDVGESEVLDYDSVEKEFQIWKGISKKCKQLVEPDRYEIITNKVAPFVAVEYPLPVPAPAGSNTMVPALQVLGDRAAAGWEGECSFGADGGSGPSASRRHLNEAIVKAIVLEVLEALVYLHDAGLSHKDLTLENLLLDSELAAMLVAMPIGSAHLQTPEVGSRKERRRSSDKTPAGNAFVQIKGVVPGRPDQRFRNCRVHCLAPETLKATTEGGGFLAKSDLWSLGILTYQLLHCGQLPWSMTALTSESFSAHLSKPATLPNVECPCRSFSSGRGRGGSAPGEMSVNSSFTFHPPGVLADSGKTATCASSPMPTLPRDEASCHPLGREEEDGLEVGTGGGAQLNSVSPGGSSSGLGTVGAAPRKSISHMVSSLLSLHQMPSSPSEGGVETTKEGVASSSLPPIANRNTSHHAITPDDSNLKGPALNDSGMAGINNGNSSSLNLGGQQRRLPLTNSPIVRHPLASFTPPQHLSGGRSHFASSSPNTPSLLVAENPQIVPCSNEVIMFMRLCCARSSLDRPSARSLRQHLWLKGSPSVSSLMEQQRSLQQGQQ